MRAKTWLIVAAFFILTGVMPPSALAAQRGRGVMGLARDVRGGMHEGFRGGFHGNSNRGVRSPRVFIGPSYGFGLGWGWGWGDPWIWGPYYYPGPNVVEVRHVNYGTLEFKVKPEDTKVYVDKKFIGTVEDLDHHKAYVEAGNHEITLEAQDGQMIKRDVYVAAGKKIKIDERL
jgi:hypothetical protein